MKQAPELLEKMLKFWAMYSYYELGYYYYYYYHLVPCNKQLLYSLLWDKIEIKKKTYRPKKSVSYIGHRLPCFLNADIGQRKILIGRPLLQTLK